MIKNSNFLVGYIKIMGHIIYAKFERLVKPGEEDKYQLVVSVDVSGGAI